MNAELVKYIEENILPRYDGFSDGHDRSHIDMVIRESLHLAKTHGADVDMAYTIAAYHDLGIPAGRANHNITSAAMLEADDRLREWFTPEQIQLMKAAVEDHRASADKPPRTLYGCIAADADHFVDPENVIRRTVLYGLANYPGLDEAGQIHRAREHMHNKYCSGGYLSFHLNDPRSLDGLGRLRRLVEDEAGFAAICRKYLNT